MSIRERIKQIQNEEQVETEMVQARIEKTLRDAVETKRNKDELSWVDLITVLFEEYLDK